MHELKRWGQPLLGPGPAALYLGICWSCEGAPHLLRTGRGVGALGHAA